MHEDGIRGDGVKPLQNGGMGAELPEAERVCLFDSKYCI